MMTPLHSRLRRKKEETLLHLVKAFQNNLILSCADDFSLLTVYYDVSDRWAVALQCLKHDTSNQLQLTEFFRHFIDAN